MFLLLVLSLSISAKAIEDVNHVSCMYLKTTGAWSSWNYSFMENLSMQPGDNRLVNSYWTGLRSQAVNRAFCSAILATQESDAIEIDFIAYKGSDFEGFEYDGTCIPLGKQLELETKKTYRVERGQYA
ncbi:hypothetical protein B9G69_010870 [Bdellovibrio sp. SKB1291214]|uniref:hypothetical protein n=1 Tax=Bdellovibrio sp. SKB1291214 TaxID=1732569 RepID=UPI001130A6C7|nr:hypothetical protein [Bdellovibrio sp. SKB1291214]UYL07546.1 hypothetical protein B9G69_010870 [Bdellovibrio sp. SKB1291214]